MVTAQSRRCDRVEILGRAEPEGGSFGAYRCPVTAADPQVGSCQRRADPLRRCAHTHQRRSADACAQRVRGSERVLACGVGGLRRSDASTALHTTVPLRRIAPYSSHVQLPGFLHNLEILADELLVSDRDLWFRTTLYVTEGHWGEGTVADLVVTAFTQQKHDPDPMRLGVSTWRRAPDVALPTRVKSSANYVVGRLARIEVRRLGFDDAVMLNDAGRVAETTGACVVIADRGRLISPPTSEGCLDSITIAVLEELCRDRGMVLERRPIERSELMTADECAVAGTISELTLIEEIDGVHYDQSGILADLRQSYLDVMRGRRALPGVELRALIRSGGLSAAQ